MKRDLIMLGIYTAFLIAVYQLLSEHLTNMEMKTEELITLEKKMHEDSVEE